MIPGFSFCIAISVEVGHYDERVVIPANAGIQAGFRLALRFGRNDEALFLPASWLAIRNTLCGLQNNLHQARLLPIQAVEPHGPVLQWSKCTDEGTDVDAAARHQVDAGRVLSR